MQPTTSSSVTVPVLNPYIISTSRKDETPSFIVLSKELVACAESSDERQLRHLQQTVLQPLSYFGFLPVAVISPLFSITRNAAQNLRKDHKKLLRSLYYQIHVLLSCGRAGTNGARDSDEVVSAAILPPMILKEYWQLLSQPTKDIAQIVACLFVMAGILRSLRTSPNKNLHKSQQERVAMTGKFVALLSGLLSAEYQPPRGDKKGLFTSRKPADEEDAKKLIQKSALACVRASLPLKELRKLMPGVFNLLKSHEALDDVSVRHVLAMAVDSCRKSTATFIQEIKFRLEATMEAYGSTGYLYPNPDGTASKPEAPNGSSPPLRLTDRFSRKYLAQACGIVIKEMGKKAKGTVFWNATVMMACGDAAPMVSTEAMKALLGSSAVREIDYLSKAKPAIEFEVNEDYESNEKETCFATWQSLMKEEVPSVLVLSEHKTSKKRTILTHMIAKLREMLSGTSQAMIAGACRVACLQLLESINPSPNQKMWQRSSTLLNPLREDLLRYATSGSPCTSALQYLSFKALIWLQGEDGGPLTPPVIVRILSTGDCWSQKLMTDVLETFFRRLIVQPSMSSYILDCVNAVVAGNPSNVMPVQLVDFWFYSVERSDKARVLSAALQFLEAPRPPRATATGHNLGAVSETYSDWRKLKSTVALWLGNAVAFLTEDNPWQERSAISLTSAQGQSTSDLISSEVTQNPLLMSTVSHFVHELTTGLLETRLAAAKALTCIAIQCQEPYRIQIYGVFKQILASDTGDVYGVQETLTKVVELLDQMYSGQLMIDECITQWGGNFASWPPNMAESVQNRHHELLGSILNHCQVPPDLFFPLGPKSRALILGEDVPIAMSTQTSMTFEPPQAQYSDYLRQGSIYIDEEYDPDNDPGLEDDTYGSPTRDDDAVALTLRDSHRTRQYLDAPSLQELVAQSPEAATYTLQHSDTYTDNAVPSHEAYTAPSGMGSYVSEEKEQYDEGVRTESSSNYQDQISSPVSQEPWQTSPTAAVNAVPSAEQEQEHTLGFEQENPFYNQEPQTQPIDFGQSVQFQTGFPKRAAVLFDFEAEMEGELTVNIGDIITIVGEIEGGWYFASVTNVLGIKNEGIVPCDYVELQED